MKDTPLEWQIGCPGHSKIVYQGASMRGGMLPMHEKGGVLLPIKPKIEGNRYVFDLQNGFLFSLMARYDEKVLFHVFRVMKHKFNT
jgi:hypothetical protein